MAEHNEDRQGVVAVAENLKAGGKAQTGGGTDGKNGRQGTSNRTPCDKKETEGSGAQWNN